MVILHQHATIATLNHHCTHHFYFLFHKVAIIPVKGFINGLAVASTGKFLLAAAGQEHRLGRWERQHTARNELCVISLFENSPRAEDIDHT